MTYVWPPTLAETKLALNKTDADDDLELQGAIDAAAAMLEAHPAYRVTQAVKPTTYTEWHTAAGHEIVLRRFPVVSVTSLDEYTPTHYPLANEPLDTTATFTSYGFDYEATNGIVTRLAGGCPSYFRGRVKAVYVAGATSPPADIREAALLLVDHLWETQRGGAGAGAPPGLETESAPGSYGYRWGPSFALPNRVRELLEPYRADALA